MKIWIVYDSRSGNTRKLAEALGFFLKEKYEIHIKNSKNIAPSTIVAEKPFAVFMGGPIHGAISFTIKRWANQFFQECEAQHCILPKGLIFCTAAGVPERANAFISTVKKKGIFTQVFPNVISMLASGISTQHEPSELIKGTKIEPIVQKFLES